MLTKIINKILLHIKNPIMALKFDVRMCYYFYGKYVMKYFYGININKENSYFSPDYCDLFNLFQIIIKYNPKSCIEVGSGYSTLIIVKALSLNFKKDKIKPKFISIEQDIKYLEIHKDYLSKSLSKDEYELIEFLFTDLVIEEISGQKVNICRNFPNHKFDFFYEDRTDDKNYKIAGDALKIEENMPQNYMICVDGMLETVEFYKKNLKRNYKYTGGFIHGSTWIPK